MFDFDSVLVDSVLVKLDAYADLFKEGSADTRRRVREFCEPRLSLTRFELVDAIARDLLKRTLSSEDRTDLLSRFSDLVVERVVAAPPVRGASDFLARYACRYRFFIVSGTPETELQLILERRNMARWFEAAYGSPTAKRQLLARILDRGFQRDEIVYVGDSNDDWTAVSSLDIPFIWRRTEPDQRRPAGFTGAVIDGLDELADHLPALGFCAEAAR